MVRPHSEKRTALHRLRYEVVHVLRANSSMPDFLQGRHINIIEVALVETL